MIAPEFTPRQTKPNPAGTQLTFWAASVIQDVTIYIIPQPAGCEIVVSEPCSTGESYGVFPTLEVAYLEACVIYADILESNPDAALARYRTDLAGRIAEATGMSMADALAEADDHIEHGRPDADYGGSVTL